MSAYDTVDRLDRLDVTVRVYSEAPMVHDAIHIRVGSAGALLTAAEAIRLATALLNAASRVTHAAVVDRVVATGAAK